MLLDGTLHRVQFFLRVKKPGGHGVFQQRLAFGFKLGNLRGFERLAVLLFFLQRLAFAHERFILGPRAGVGQKRVDAFADGNHFRLGDNDPAKFLRFFFNDGWHKLFAPTIKHVS
jgi:hypothetical protein